MPKKLPDDLLSYCHSYFGSALTLISQVGTKAKFITGLKLDKGYILAAHFLMAHGTELYLKLCIELLGGKVPTDKNGHNLKKLLTILSPLCKKHYKHPPFNKKLSTFIDYLNRNTKFRYPRDKQWNHIPDIFKEAEKWSAKKAGKFFNNWNELRDRFNDLGYKIAHKEGFQ